MSILRLRMLLRQGERTHNRVTVGPFGEVFAAFGLTAYFTG